LSIRRAEEEQNEESELTQVGLMMKKGAKADKNQRDQH